MGSDDRPVRGDRPRAGTAASAREHDMLQVALEAAQLAVWEVDLQAQAMHASAALFRLLKYASPVEPWTLRDFEQHVFADDLAVFREALASALGAGELRCEMRLRRCDGRLAWVSMLGRRDPGSRGGCARLTGVLQDISERKANEQFMREREAQFTAMFEVSNVGMAHADPLSGTLVRTNGRLAKMLDYTPSQLVGRRFLPLVHAEDRPGVGAGLQQLAAGALNTFETETRLLHRNGSTVWTLMTVNVIRDSLGQSTRTVAVIVDITRRKRAEQALLEHEDELRRARDELERRADQRTAELAETNAALQIEIAERRAAEERVRELLALQVQAVEEERSRISRELHDTLGQHLPVLALALKSIAQQAGASAGVQERAARAQESLRLMEDELDRLSYELRPLALDDLGLAEALRSHAAHWSNDTGVSVDLHTHGLRTGRLPPVVETTVYRIVQEALTNVRKHAKAKRVGLIVERRANQVRVVLEDDGTGFDLGTVASEASEAGRRLGLRGMSERARLVGGELEVESVPGRGTTLYLVLPVHAGDDEVAA